MTKLISNNKLLFHVIINLTLSSSLVLLKSYCGGYIEGVCYEVGLVLSLPAFYLLALITGVNYTMHFVSAMVFKLVSFILYVLIIAALQFAFIKLLTWMSHKGRRIKADRADDSTGKPLKHFIMRKTTIMLFTIVFALVIGITIYACIPRVEEMSFTAYNNRFKNHLGIKVNTTKLTWFQGNEGFIRFDSDYYSITMLTKGERYDARDMDITIRGRNKSTLTPKEGAVLIVDQSPQSMVIRVTLNDDRIPKLINGTSTLKANGSTADYVSYEMK